MADGKVSEIKTQKKRIIKANIYQPHSALKTKHYLSGYYRNSRSRKNSDSDTYNSETKTKGSKTQLLTTPKPNNTKIIYEIGRNYKDIESCRKKIDSQGKFKIRSIYNKF
jgi:hypothetical protein